MGHYFLSLVFLVLGLISQATFAQDNGDYQLGPGDTIRIQVFRNPDLTLETRVSEGGSITFPLIGSIDVGGMTINAAESRIGDALRDGGFLQQPQVNITLLQIRGSQVVVLGQVGRPGRYPLETAKMRLSDILALAGGTVGGADSIVITGNRAGKVFHREIDIAGIFLDKRGENDIVMAGGDIIYVHRPPVYYVYGEVQRPGSFRVERRMFVMQALAQAGGVSLRGTVRGMRLYRRNPEGILETMTPEMTTEVMPDDVIFINERIF